MTTTASPRQVTTGAVANRTAEVLASVSSWWTSQAQLAGLDGQWLDVREALAAQPPERLPTVPPSSEVTAGTSPEELGELYVSSLSSASRSKNGQHYTPSTLANRVWEMTRTGLKMTRGRDQQLHGLVRDPACGAGALLLPPLREHLRASDMVDPALVLRALPSRVQGVDLDPWAVWITNVVTAAETLHIVARISPSLRSPIPELATVGDGLAERELAWATIMNPPYGRLKLDDDTRAAWGHVLYGHANLYGLFMAAGAANTRTDGVLTALVPTSFTAGRYFYRLREYLGSTMPLTAMNFVEGRNGIFAGVLQETCVATFKKGPRHLKVTRSNGEVSPVAEVPVPKSNAPWMLPREAIDAPTASAAAKMKLTLADAGWLVSTGPLVWNRRKSDLSSRPGKNRAMILWAADIDGGEVHRDRARDSMRYLSLAVKSDPTVMVLNEPAVLVQRTTAPEQHRRLVAAELTPEFLDGLHHGVVVENHVNVLRPSETPLISRSALARVLQTRTFDRLVRCISGSVALSAYELASLPVPNAEVLASWEKLQGEDLEKAVSAAYTPGASR